MDKRPRFIRRNYFINKEFQGRYIFNYFIFTAIGSLIFLGIFSFFSSNTLSITYNNYHLQLGVTPGILFTEFLSTQWLFLVLGGGSIIVITLFLTHRVAGPFYRLERSLDEMIQGDISNKIILRKKDEGKGLAKKINSFNHNLSEKLTAVESSSSHIAVTITRLKNRLQNSPENDCGELMALIDTLEADQQRIQDTVDYFTCYDKIR